MLGGALADADWDPRGEWCRLGLVSDSSKSRIMLGAERFGAPSAEVRPGRCPRMPRLLRNSRTSARMFTYTLVVAPRPVRRWLRYSPNDTPYRILVVKYGFPETYDVQCEECLVTPDASTRS